MKNVETKQGEAVRSSSEETKGRVKPRSRDTAKTRHRELESVSNMYSAPI